MEETGKEGTQTENELELNYSKIQIHDAYQREKYIKNSLEEINEVSAQIDNLNMEYSVVTSYLLDIEEIEALPKEEKDEVLECANIIERYESERTNYQGRKGVISEKDFLTMEKIEDLMPEAYEKLKAAEEMKPVESLFKNEENNSSDNEFLDESNTILKTDSVNTKNEEEILDI